MKSNQEISADKSGNRKYIIQFRVSEDEKNFIEKKAELSGSKNVSSYLRKAAITSNIIRYTGEDITPLIRRTYGLANNINQIAVRVNSTGTVYSEDITEIKGKVEEYWLLLQSIQSILLSIKL